MSQRAPSLVQRFFKAIFPRSWGADMEADSRRWMVICPCGNETSIWDLGGIRWKATGNSRTLMKCRQCGKRTWHRLERREAPAQAAPTHPKAPR